MSSGKNVVDFRKRIKIALVKAFDSKCQVCGESFPAFIFDFHHLKPEEKSFGLSNAATTRAKSAYADEAKKCIMVCAHCHRYIEYADLDVSDKKSAFNEEIYYKTIDELTSHNKEIVEERKVFSTKPSREQLKEDIRSMSMLAVGRKYSVSDNAVRKWCRSYQLPSKVGDIKQYSDEEWLNI